MVSKKDSNKARLQRHKRVRAKISGTAERPRLDVFRSAKNIYAQVIDYVAGVTLVSASTAEKSFTEYGGNKEAAKEGGKAAVEAAKAAGWTDIKCIEIAGVQGDATNTARMEGYREGVNEAGGEFLDAETQYANATADLAVTAMEGIMSKYPEGVAIICSNNDDMALAAARTAKDNPNYAKTIFLGFDGQKSAVEAVLNGELTMTAAQNNFDIGYKAVETIVKILNGEEYGDVDTGTEIITKDNAQARLDNFANWLK